MEGSKLFRENVENKFDLFSVEFQLNGATLDALIHFCESQ
jgi:hypothetical protein